MARHTHASFEGVEILDVDPNALTRTRWLDKSVGDTALVYDLLTGATGNLDQGGGGDGCTLGIPLANQMLDFYTVTGDGDTAAAEAVCIWQLLALQPAGEDSITIELDWATYEPGTEPLVFEVRDSSWAVVDSVDLSDNASRATISGLTERTLYTYRVVCSDVSRWNPTPGNVLAGVSLGNFRIAPDGTPLMTRQPTDPTDSTELATKTVSSATVIDAHDFDTQEVQSNGMALSGYHVTQLAQTQSALIEMLSGAPVGTNESRTIAPSSTQGAFFDHSRLGSEFSSMPLVAAFPLGGWCLGASPEDGGTGKDGVGGNATGTRNAPGWATTQSATLRPLYDACFWAPQDNTGRLKWYVLAYSPDGLLGSLTTSLSAEVYDNSNTSHSGPTSTSTWTQLGTSKFYYASITGMSHAPAQLNRCTLHLAISAGGAKSDGSSVRIVSIFAELS